MTDFAQQAVEKIDRTRGLAGKLFCNLVHANPPIPYICHQERLKQIFPEDISTVLWLFADHTFPLFCSMLELKEYSERLILGLSASMGQLTESLVTLELCFTNIGINLDIFRLNTLHHHSLLSWGHATKKCHEFAKK